MPKLVERLDSHTAVAVVCPGCGWRGKDDDPANGLVAEGMVTCPKCKATDIEYEYDVGLRCTNCDKVDYDQPLRDDGGSYCSRVCQLQAEYARSLASDGKQP